MVDTLSALGVEAVSGLPGIHALAIWEALRASSIRTCGFRTELNAGFAACGAAHVTGRSATLIVSTGPGALNSLTAVMEAASSHLPVVVIASQIPVELLGRGRGYLHELHDQAASFAPIVKATSCVRSQEDIPEQIVAAFRAAMTPPSGPAYVEIPVDLLTAEASVEAPARIDATPDPESASVVAVQDAARLLSSLPDPVIWAGSGVIRSGAWLELVRLAERLDAPVATTYMGKGAIPDDHPLAAGSSCDDRAYQDLLAHAGVVLCAGTELGAETTGQHSLRFRGELIQLDADASRIGSTYPAHALVGDARATLRALLPLVEARHGDGALRAEQVRSQARGSSLELQLLDTIRAAVPCDAVTAWDMTILGYWAAARWPALEPRRFLYPLGSGTLGFAWPAALGAAAALPTTQCVAVVGDGGFMYGMSELLTARQHGLAARLIIVDDGGYGILREYQRDAYGRMHGVDLRQPDFPALIAACGVAVRATSPSRLGVDLEWALEVDGPAALVLSERLAYSQQAV